MRSEKRGCAEGFRQPGTAGAGPAIGHCLSAQAWRKVGLFGDDGGIGGVAADAVDALEAAGLGLIAFAGEDDFPVGGLQAEAELPCLVLIDLELGVLAGGALLGLVLQPGGDGVLADGLDAVLAGGFGRIGFADADDLTVAGPQHEANTLVVGSHDEFTHKFKPPVFFFSIAHLYTKINGQILFPKRRIAMDEAGALQYNICECEGWEPERERMHE